MIFIFVIEVTIFDLNIVIKSSKNKSNIFPSLELTLAKPVVTSGRLWWDWQGIIYYELLPYGQVLLVLTELYSKQLDRPSERSNCPGGTNRVGFLCDTPEASKAWLGGSYAFNLYVVQTWNLEITHYLFMFMANDLAGEKFASKEICEKRLS